MSRISACFLACMVAAGSSVAEEPPKVAAAADPVAAQKASGQAFLAGIDEDKAVKKLPSGLRIKTLRAGDGASPAASDSVKVHYRGTLTDGTEFDSSYKRDMPATFPLMGVIKCWTEGLQLMKTGGKSILYCPPEIAYGEPGHPPVIPQAATLVFEVELLEIVGGKGAAAVK